MKRLVVGLIAMLLLSLLTLQASAQEPQSYQEALQTMHQSGKRGFILLTASWCGPCRRLKEEVLTPYFHILRKDYVIYFVDIDADKETARLYRESGMWGGSVPTYFLTSPGGGKIIARGEGYKSQKDFVDWYNGLFYKK